MRFYADLHVHSRYARATSRDLDLENLAYWARRKGIGVVATGDFTHPAWMAELKEKLVPAEPGLFRLRPDIEQEVERRLTGAVTAAPPTRFLLEVEISTIYKKGGKTRKIHHLLYAPDFDSADNIRAALGRIGNLNADGRPILGLDSRNLLEITLQSGEHSYLIPAHVWTPWFAALGSRGGFDSIEECYGDLTGHIFAVETGLSSDPAMNWRVAQLDRYRLTSSSDAHSPGKLGREATLFDTDMDYFAIKHALETGEGYVGTAEFFPEEGKYHMDGHRACNIRLSPEETKRNDGRCPVCGQPVTIGVMHRVDELADRTEEEALANPPATAGQAQNLVPLPEIVSEIVGSGPSSQKAVKFYDHLISSVGSELDILSRAPLEDIERAGSSLMAEAIARLRQGKVIRDAGYDGEYGVIRLFQPDELKSRTSGGLLFSLPEAKKNKKESVIPTKAGTGSDQAAPDSRFPPPPAGLRRTSRGNDNNKESDDDLLAALDPGQREAASITEGPLMITAGPGSGKTRTLTYRIAHLIKDKGIAPGACLAVTFTRRAAFEMKERLEKLLPQQAAAIPVHTFHTLGLQIIGENRAAAGLHRDFRIADETERAQALAPKLDLSESKARQLLHALSRAKRTGQNEEHLDAYQRMMAENNWLDFDDLVGLAAQLLKSDPGLAASYQERWRRISIDEYQDIDAQQYRLIRLLAPPASNLCVIGDPDQAIYGFRGADSAYFRRFREDYPGAKAVALTRNYRSGRAIVAASAQVISAGNTEQRAFDIVRDTPEKITIHAAASDKAEAEFIVRTIEDLLGGHSFFSRDTKRGVRQESAYAFSDFAVLYRTEGQADALAEALQRSGMPFGRYSAKPLIENPEIKDLTTKITKDTKAEDILRDLRGSNDELLFLLEKCGGDLQKFLQELRLLIEADLYDPRGERIALMTLHASKGLEFPVVFVTGLEDGILPLFFGDKDKGDEAEERRLFFVGMTRAQDLLYLSRAEKRLWRGAVRELPASPFLQDIERALADHSRTEMKMREETGPEQLTLL